MDVIFKKYYPFAEDSRLFLQTFLTWKTYKIVNSTIYENENWYSIDNEYNTVDMFNQTDFDDYFITKKELRSKKLQKITNNL